MLLIGDVHITWRMTQSIIGLLRNFVDANPNEKNIIFAWDYVYHFAYDRAALFSLYEFFVTLFEQGKSVYVLAWNHDRLTDSFVYAEAKKAFDILHSNSVWKLHFITQPELHTIDGEKVFFLPYMIQQTDDWEKTLWPIASTHKYPAIEQQINALTSSENKNERFSAYINNILLQVVESHDELTVIHHYYTNNIQFPWYKARFAFKDIALSEQFLDISHIKLMSGHVHNPFAYKNYLCIGSVRSTSSLESNTIRGLFTYKNKQVSMDICMINPYRSFTQEIRDILHIQDWLITIDAVQKIYDYTCTTYIDEYLQSDSYTITTHIQPQPPIDKIHLQIIADDMDYAHLEKYVDQTIVAQCKDIKLKKYNPAVQDLLEQFTSSQQKVVTTFSDRKQVLKEYIQTKYPDDYDRYDQIMQDMKIV